MYVCIQKDISHLKSWRIPNQSLDNSSQTFKSGRITTLCISTVCLPHKSGHWSEFCINRNVSLKHTWSSFCKATSTIALSNWNSVANGTKDNSLENSMVWYTCDTYNKSTSSTEWLVVLIITSLSSYMHYNWSV